jgi:hypothetical protein
MTQDKILKKLGDLKRKDKQCGDHVLASYGNFLRLRKSFSQWPWCTSIQADTQNKKAGIAVKT